MITVTSFPNADIQGNSANKSWWSAVHHPVVWNLRRSDFNVVEVGRFFGSTVVAYAELETGAGAEAVIGDYVYLSSVDATVQIGGVAGDIITFNYLAPASPVAGGFINYVSARKNYFVETIVYAINDSWQLTNLGTIVNVASPSGYITVNVMEYLKSLVDYKETFLFNEVIGVDYTLGGKYTVGFTENYNTTRVGYGSVDYLGDHNYVNATKQVKDLYGVNMADYVPSLDYEGAKFMSDFVRPTKFSGLPFALTFIMSDKICAVFNSDYSGLTNLQAIFDSKDINGGELGFAVIDIYDSSSTENVYRLLVDESNINGSAKTLQVYLTTGYGDEESYHKLTETKVIKYISDCFNNPIYLNWLGTNGGRNFWLFDTQQDDVLEVTSGGDFTPQPVDLEMDLGNGECLTKNAAPELVCHAYLELEDIRGLKGLMMSPDVLMLTNPETWTDNPTSPVSPIPKWERVKVLPQTFKVLSTNATHAEIEITLLLPTINIQSQ